MNFLQTKISGVVIVEPDVHRDGRGFFLESYHEQHYREGGIDARFVQDNHSRSLRGTLRGLHLQLAHPQAKLVRVVVGAVFDVAVDVRRGSPHFGEWFGVALSADNHRQLFVPAGFAHGFAVTSEIAEFEYKCSEFYDPTSEVAIAWNDPQIGVVWPIDEPLLSTKDTAAPSLADLMDVLPAWHSDEEAVPKRC